MKIQYRKKDKVNSRTRAGRTDIMETSFEEISRKYRSVKAGKSGDLFCLKSEIESYIKAQQSARRKDENYVDKAKEMLMDVTQMIEEDRCSPLRPRNSH